MKQKILQILWICIFFWVFWYFYGDQYWSFQSQKGEEYSFQEEVRYSIQHFSFKNIKDLSQGTEFFVTPNLDLLDSIVTEIDSAQKRVYVEVYIFTEKKIRDALIDAFKRGVEVKVLLENNPYQAPYLNDKHYNTFQESGIDVRWSDPLNYSLNHSKLLIIDNEAYVSTGNFSYSLFKYNRDFLVKLENKEIVEKLRELFLWDYFHKNIWVIHPNLVISPDYSRAKMQNLIDTAKENIDFYFPYMKDEEFERKMIEAKNRGVSIRWIVEEKFFKTNTDIVRRFQEAGIEISYLSKKKLHAKSMLIDNNYLYIGSINFSRYSFDENREIWIILKDQKIISQFQDIFKSDL